MPTLKQRMTALAALKRQNKEFKIKQAQRRMKVDAIQKKNKIAKQATSSSSSSSSPPTSFSSSSSSSSSSSLSPGRQSTTVVRGPNGQFVMWSQILPRELRRRFSERFSLHDNALHDTYVLLGEEGVSKSFCFSLKLSFMSGFSSESPSDLARLGPFCQSFRKKRLQQTVIVAVGTEAKKMKGEGLLWLEKDFAPKGSFLEIIKAYQPRKVMLDYFFFVDAYAQQRYGRNGWFEPDGHILTAFSQCLALKEIVLPYLFFSCLAVSNKFKAALETADLFFVRRAHSELSDTDKTLNLNWKEFGKGTPKHHLEKVGGFIVFQRKN